MEARKKRLLFVNNRFPLPIEMGIDARVTSLLAAFSRKFDLDLVCPVRWEYKLNYIPELKQYCRHVEAFLAPNRKSLLHRLVYKILFVLSYLFKGTPSHLFYTSLSEIRKRILNLIRNNPYDIIFFEYWFWDKELIQACNGLKVVDANDVQFIRESRIQERKVFPLLKPFIRFQLHRYKKKEIERMKLFDLIIATKEEDRETFHRLLGSQKEIIISPTGVDIDYFSPRAVSPEEKVVIFYGAMNSHMNIDGALYLYRKIMPFIWKQRKDVKLMILGSNPPTEISALASNPLVIVTGYVKDVRDYLAMGNVVTLPLRMEYGHRGRIFEVMAMAIPIVVTPQAIQGMGIRTGEGVLIKESPLSFAQAVLRILGDRTFAEELGMKGRIIVLERFSTEATYNRLVDFLFKDVH
jgi:glycosyltransferase involved in cell wall biosynthesis